MGGMVNDTGYFPLPFKQYISKCGTCINRLFFLFPGRKGAFENPEGDFIMKKTHHIRRLLLL